MTKLDKLPMAKIEFHSRRDSIEREADFLKELTGIVSTLFMSGSTGESINELKGEIINRLLHLRKAFEDLAETSQAAIEVPGVELKNPSNEQDRSVQA